MESYNPHLLPSSLPKKDHHRAVMVGIWTMAVAVIFGTIYLWKFYTPASKAPVIANTPPTLQEQLDQVSTELAQIQIPDVESQMDQVTAQLQSINNARK